MLPFGENTSAALVYDRSRTIDDATNSGVTLLALPRGLPMDLPRVLPGGRVTYSLNGP